MRKQNTFKVKNMLQFITEQGLQELSIFVARKVLLVIKHNQQIKHKSKLQFKKV